MWMIVALVAILVVVFALFAWLGPGSKDDSDPWFWGSGGGGAL